MPAPSVPVEPKARRLAGAVVVALVALRMWTKRVSDRQPQPFAPLDGCRFVPEPKRRGRVIGSMIAAAAVVVGAGIWVFPPSDVEPDILAPFALGFPLVVNDGHSVIPLGRVGWFETHGEAADLPYYRFAREYPLPAYVPGTVRAMFWAEWNAPVAQDVPITLSITLPPGAKVASCHGPGVECPPVPPPPRAGQPGFAQGDCITIKVPIREGQWEVEAVVDIVGSKGLAVTTNRTRARVQYPVLIPAGEKVEKPVDFGAGFSAQLAAALPDVAGYGWSPEVGLGPVGNVVAWQMVIPLSPNSASPTEGWRVAGVRNAVLRNDDLRRFASGIAFGVGGSALIVVIQTVVEAFPFEWLTGLLGRVRRRSR